MEHSPKPGDKMIIAHWTYSREEWRNFLKWKEMKKSFFHLLVYYLRPLKHRKAPEIKIMPDKVWTNDNHEPFHDGDRRFRKINIHDAGKMNIMEISYECGTTSSEISIPIPKGKLREAMEVQDRLMRNHLFIA